MRGHSILVWAVCLQLAACSDPSTDGTLLISTATSGGDPDPDGFELTIDSADSIALGSTDTAEVAVAVGQHTLQLLGVAGQCSVDPGSPLDVAVTAGETTRLTFAIDCPTVGARVAITTTGLDIDQDGYRVVVDGTDRAPIASSGSVFAHADPGSRTITLAGLASNCAIQGSASQTVTVVANEIVPVEFAVRCTATLGVIAVSINASGTDAEGQYQVIADALPQLTLPDGPGSGAFFLTGGDHIVRLVAPVNCSVQTKPQPVTVTVGGLTRDTVDVAFSAYCVANVGTLRITAPTTGPVPTTPYSVGICDANCENGDNGPTAVGNVVPNDTLIADVRASPGARILELGNVPPNCTTPNFDVQITVNLFGDTLDVEFPVTCAAGTSGTGTVRISASTTGNLARTTQYTVWSGHYGAWDYGDEWTVLGSIYPNGTLVTQLEASMESGADPYWYDFKLTGVPTSCTVQNPVPDPGPYSFTIPLGGMRDIQFVVHCP
jgi:hypothetical protein